MNTEDKTKVKIFQMNDIEWVAAETIGQAKKFLAEMLGVDICDLGEYLDEPHAISEESMDRLIFN